MKILQINKFFYRAGGSETYFFDLMKAQEAAGHDIIHFSMEDERNEPSPYADYFIRNINFQGAKTLAKGAHYVYSLEAAEMVKRLVKKTRPDVAHLHNIAHQLTPSIMVALRQLGVPVVQTLHDYQLLCPNYKLFTQGSACERCKSHRYWNAIRYSCMQGSKTSSALAAFEMTFHNLLLKTYEWGVQRFITPSKFLHAKLMEWGWQQSDVVTIPHFVNKQRNPGIARHEQLLFAGRMIEEKGPLVLLEAARLLQQEFPALRIVFAGDGPTRSICEQRANQLGLHNCIFLGAQTSVQLDRLMQESAAVVVPSLWYENAPMVIYEALALGTPVIGSRLGGIVELVNDGQNGYLVEPANPAEVVRAVRRLLSSPLTIGPNHFTQEAHLQQLHALYETVQQSKQKSLIR